MCLHFEYAGLAVVAEEEVAEVEAVCVADAPTVNERWALGSVDVGLTGDHTGDDGRPLLSKLDAGGEACALPEALGVVDGIAFGNEAAFSCVSGAEAEVVGRCGSAGVDTDAPVVKEAVAGERVLLRGSRQCNGYGDKGKEFSHNCCYEIKKLC